MATPPKVQTISEVQAELNPLYAQSEAVIQKRQAGLGQKYGAQKAALTAEKGEGFNAINSSVNSRGLAFGGFAADEQARYLATKYLPGLQQADYQMNEEDLAMQGQLAQIGLQKGTQAFGVVQDQKKDLNSWNMNEYNNNFTAEQNRISRDFTAAQSAEDRAFRANESAADRSFQAGQAAQNRSHDFAMQAPSGPTNSDLLDGMSAWAKGRVGAKDRKLSPEGFKTGYQQWLRLGGPADPAQYTAAMYGYVNNKHAKDYIF